MTVVRSSITITDLTDGVSVNAVLQASQGFMQIKGDGANYTPDFAVNNNIITPKLLVSGQTTEKLFLTAPTWYVNNTEVTASTEGYAVGDAADGFPLIMSTNMNIPTINIRTEGIYSQDEMETPISAEITLSRIDNASSGYAMLIKAPSTILNDTTPSVEITAEMYLGTNPVGLDATYAWYEFGILENGEPGWKECPASMVNYNVLTVERADVESQSNFKVIGGVTGETSSASKPEAIIVITDLTDAYSVSILGSDKLKPTAPATTLSLKLTKNGEDVDISVASSIKWSKLDKDGTPVGGVISTDPTLVVNRDMIQGRATFVVELTV